MNNNKRKHKYYYSKISESVYNFRPLEIPDFPLPKKPENLPLLVDTCDIKHITICVLT